MGRSPCCEKVGLKKGPWTPEEDQKLLAYIEEHGHGSWRALPAKAGLQRCGKSCRLRWTNYLRPDIKRGKFSLQEEQTIIQLHALLGNRWSAIATHLPKRTDNEIKNYWNTHLKKRLAKMGIDPVTHKPKNETLGSPQGYSKSTANLSHIAQWESARLEAEARLARESKLRATSLSATLRTTEGSPTSTLSFSENNNMLRAAINGPGSGELVADEEVEWKCLGKRTNTDFLGFQVDTATTLAFGGEVQWIPETSDGEVGAGFTGMLLDNSSDVGGGESNNARGGSSIEQGEESGNYWNSIFNLVISSSPPDSPSVF
uniref:Uncharacterized protein n=1 Tax=Ananas comosus var. bracteatus TaxID=296719 RepID=A0A6V7P6R8_ANACO|nr:unnamed protein product [Ananas comosus var. bracteatus]